MQNEMIFDVVVEEGCYMPESAHDDDAGYDLRTPAPFILCPGESVTVDTGVHIAIPKGYVGFLKSKSGLNMRDHVTGEGVIDSGYTGPICVKLYHNRPDKPEKRFNRGDKIIQIVFLPIVKPELRRVQALEQTERGDGGFGSTGA